MCSITFPPAKPYSYSGANRNITALPITQLPANPGLTLHFTFNTREPPMQNRPWHASRPSQIPLQTCVGWNQNGKTDNLALKPQKGFNQCERFGNRAL
ncbi:4-hydroxyphenylpyruvate dioxygenase [Histoplasma ohiense]|nr:4-hydroxyphenylpyruvate dioxygenase [Histoplasma ohiense (nom. inval.)]